MRHVLTDPFAGYFYLCRDMRSNEQVLVYCYNVKLEIREKISGHVPELVTYNYNTKKLETSLGFPYHLYYAVTELGYLDQDILTKFAQFLSTERLP